MSATATIIRVPVRTWQEKAILAAAIGDGLSGAWERFDGHAGSNFDHLVDSSATDTLIDDYFGRRPEILMAEEILRALRRITPGPGSTIDIPLEARLLKRLDSEISDMAEMDIDSILVPHPSRREMAEALIVAIDLRDELAGGDA